MKSNKTSNSTIFIVEDDLWYSEILDYHLSLNPDNIVKRFSSGKEVLDHLYLKPDLITLDYTLPDFNGDELFKKIKQINSSIPVVIISGQEDIKTAIQLLKEGAYDYLVKDEETKDRLWNIVSHLKDHKQLIEEVEELRKEVVKKYDFNKTIIGSSKAINKIFPLLEKSCKSNINVSITGETGTGKEVVAKTIHYNSEQRKGPFVAVNVSAIPSELIESELFGHEKGSFTGANSRRIGKFEEASGGTLFLDEVGEMDLNMQVKLLRVLQEKEVVRVGSNSPIKINVRIITATHRNLEDLVNSGKFREDLYYRLIGLPIELPPLRERGEDVLVLSEYFISNYCKENKYPKLNLSKEAKDKLLSHHYPGNVRELQAIINLACVMSDNDVIEDYNIKFNTGKNLNDFLQKELTLDEYNRIIIKSFLEKYDHNVVLVADKLGIGKSTIYKMIKEKEI